MTFLIISFVAGLLTVLAPCTLPLLPVVIGTSASGRSKATPYIVVISLAVSIIIFTFLLKASTAFISIPESFWTYFSGGIVFLFGIVLVFPNLWERIPGINKFSIGSNKLLGKGYTKKSLTGDIIIGASLGPVFSSCSPTYFVILASVLPASFLLGSIYLLSYTLGLSLVLLAIALLGEKFASKLARFSDPHSPLKRIIGVIFIILGLLIALGYEKKLETAILDSGFLDVTKLENRILKKVDMKEESAGSNPYKEIVNPSGFINTDDKPIKIADYVGEKVILLDVMTYSCINCQRTFPYVTSWFEKYKDDGLIVIGIHTPEFAFEKLKSNVERAMKEFGINFPVIMDNEYGTWNAYGNRYWPRKYLIDIHGNIVYDHIGEGAYEETEKKIKELLAERKMVLGEGVTSDIIGGLVSSEIREQKTTARSPETYFGSLRNEYLGNGIPGQSGDVTFKLPQDIIPNTLYLDGKWNVTGEHARAQEDSSVVYYYFAKDVYIVASSDAGADMEIWQDGKIVTALTGAGSDVNKDGIVNISESKLYKIISNSSTGEHLLQIKIKKGNVDLFAFTFG